MLSLRESIIIIIRRAWFKLACVVLGIQLEPIIMLSVAISTQYHTALVFVYMYMYIVHVYILGLEEIERILFAGLQKHFFFLQAKEELSSWGLALSPNMLQTTGRKLLSEKIHFKDNSIVAGLEADWNKELIKEHVISAVPLRKWLLVFTKRDTSKAMDFLNMMKKVAPPMGIEVSQYTMYLEIYRYMYMQDSNSIILIETSGQNNI